jgi:hypothetical protein
LAYFAWLYALTWIVPGYDFTGPPIRDGRVLTFHCNGLPILALTIVAYVLLASQGVISWSLAYDHFWPLFSWANIIAVATSAFLFIRGRFKGMGSGLGLWEDFVMGQELVGDIA